MKTSQIFLFALMGCTSFVFSQSYSGVLTHTNSYFTMEPFNGSYDDGSAARIFYDGNNRRIQFWNTGTTPYTHINVGDIVSNGDLEATGNITTSGNVGIGTSAPGALLHVNNGNNSYGTILANADESNFSLYAKTLTTSPNFVESFRLGLKYASHEDNGYISFYRGGGTGGGFLGLSTSGLERIRIASNGDVGIGTSSPDDKLTVKGRIHAEEVKIDLSVPGPDYVFKEGYDLKSLEEVQEHIQEKGHLPNIPSAQEMQENGVELGIMNMKLLEKIEELTLYMIDMNNRVGLLEKENLQLKKESAKSK